MGTDFDIFLEEMLLIK